MVSDIDHVDELLGTYKLNHKQALKECDKKLKKQPRNVYLIVSSLYLSSPLTLIIADAVVLAFRIISAFRELTRG